MLVDVDIIKTTSIARIIIRALSILDFNDGQIPDCTGNVYIFSNNTLRGWGQWSEDLFLAIFTK